MQEPCAGALASAPVEIPASGQCEPSDMRGALRWVSPSLPAALADAGWSRGEQIGEQNKRCCFIPLRNGYDGNLVLKQ